MTVYGDTRYKRNGLFGHNAEVWMLHGDMQLWWLVTGDWPYVQRKSRRQEYNVNSLTLMCVRKYIYITDVSIFTFIQSVPRKNPLCLHYKNHSVNAV